MDGKLTKENATEQQLPRLGIAPYLTLMGDTASSETDQDAAQLGLLMLWLGDHVLDIMDLELSSYSITESKLDLLLMLFLHADKELLTPSALADRMGIRRSSVTALLNWLEKRNWINRESYDKDGRMTHVRINAEGRVFLQQVLPQFWSTCASLIEDLDTEERKLFSKVLLKLNDRIEKRLGVGR
ncbi:MarR family transcriptional regulator [Paenibacillus sp. SYP-B3998]|uniref:MarR family transcriptional regulator n=1 Tax=Paenibacillus sp. SYP-B3998 TaxID=2678564 RepID=A0A6G3ZU18_9BACL|nr:MarR family transcriptional regulator [Paenibacillus sp. SYP-B3998]NEW05703.1 MarR family transcriptional regulator [Paenibacillus sp. SYP-B3998]